MPAYVWLSGEQRESVVRGGKEALAEVDAGGGRVKEGEIVKFLFCHGAEQVTGTHCGAVLFRRSARRPRRSPQ